MEEFGDFDLEDLDNQFENACGASGDEAFLASVTPLPSVTPVVLDASVKRCSRCHERAMEYMTRESLESCWPCMEDGVVSRFKTLMNRVRDRHKVVRVGIAFSGGLSSWTMLNLLSELRGGERGTRQIKLFEGDIIIIDESLAVATIASSLRDSMSEDEIVRHTTQTIEELKALIPLRYQMGFHAIPLEDVFNDSDFEGIEEVEVEKRRELKRQRLRSLFSSISTLTSKEDLLVSLRTRLLLKTAARLGLERLLMGDSDITQAIKVMSSTCSARGLAVPHEIAFASEMDSHIFSCSSDQKNVTILRPLREHTHQEIEIYSSRHSGITQTDAGIEVTLSSEEALSLKKEEGEEGKRTSLQLFVPSIYHPKVIPSATRKSSLHRLVEDFILGLQKDFPQTIHPILRTADKLCLPNSVPSSSKPQPSQEKKSRRGKPAILMQLGASKVASSTPACSICLLPFHPSVLNEGISFIRSKTSAAKPLQIEESNKSPSASPSSSASCTDCYCNSSTSSTSSSSNLCDSASSSSSSSSTSSSSRFSGCCSTRRDKAIVEHLEKLVCLSCRHLVGDLRGRGEELLPDEVFRGAKSLMSSNQLREKISDFLLEDDT